MIATCIVVGGAMAVILIWFLRRLKKIEEQRWGKKPDAVKGKEKNRQPEA
jgi:hypothetical protein